MIDCLLKTNSFDIDIRDFSEKTPLHYAALNGADEVVADLSSQELQMILVTQVFEFLVGSKADIDALDAVSDDKFGKVCLVFIRKCFKGWGDTSSLCSALGKRVYCQVHPQKKGFIWTELFSAVFNLKMY